MSVQKKHLIPQEGTTTTGSGEPLTASAVSPVVSGGGFLHADNKEIDMSGLAKAITETATDATTVSQWNVAAHKRPLKKESKSVANTKKVLKGQPERSRPNRRARREALQHKDKTSTVTSAAAAAETQREPEPSTSGKTATVQQATGPRSSPPLPLSQSKRRRKSRGSRGRRIAAMATTAPAKEQSGGVGAGPSERASSKRTRLDETQSPRGDAKRAKPDVKPKRTVSYADASQSHLRVAVITVPPRDLTPEQADQLRETIDDGILQAVLSPSSPSVQAPSFRGRPFLMDGALAMWCENANALDWLERTVKTMVSPIPNTSLAVIRQSEMKKRLKAGLLIHTRITEAATLQKVLCAQNPWYKVDTWQCYDMSVDDKPNEAGSKEKVVHLVLGIPEDQRQTILDRDRRVAHMSGSGYIRFFSPEEEDKAKTKPASSETSKETSTPEASTPAPQQGQSRMDTNSPLQSEGATSDEDDVLRSP